MKNLSEIENIMNKETKRIQIHVPIQIVNDLDLFCSRNNITSRKKLIEILVIKFVNENNQIRR